MPSNRVRTASPRPSCLLAQSSSSQCWCTPSCWCAGWTAGRRGASDREPRRAGRAPHDPPAPSTTRRGHGRRRHRTPAVRRGTGPTSRLTNCAPPQTSATTARASTGTTGGTRLSARTPPTRPPSATGPAGPDSRVRQPQEAWRRTGGPACHRAHPRLSSRPVFSQARWLCAIRQQFAFDITKAALHKRAGVGACRSSVLVPGRSGGC